MRLTSEDRRTLVWPGVLVVTLLAYGAVLSAGVGSPVRPLVATFFFLVCPGLAVVPLLRLRYPLTEFVAVVSLSLVLDLLVSMSLLYLGVWTWQRALVLLVNLVAFGAAVQLLRVLREAHQRDRYADG